MKSDTNTVFTFNFLPHFDVCLLLQCYFDAAFILSIIDIENRMDEKRADEFSSNNENYWYFLIILIKLYKLYKSNNCMHIQHIALNTRKDQIEHIFRTRCVIDLCLG